MLASHGQGVKEKNNMSKYVLINLDGTNAFYDSNFHSAIPSGALEINESDYQKFFLDNGKYIFSNINETATLSEVTVSLAQMQAIKIAAIDTAATAAYTGGFTSSANGMALYYDSDQYTQQEIALAAALAAADNTQFTTNFASGFPIRAKASSSAADSTKSEYYLTAAQTITLGSDWIVRYKAIKAQVWTLKASVYACTTAAATSAITISIS
jgi:hypothetical protein